MGGEQKKMFKYIGNNNNEKLKKNTNYNLIFVNGKDKENTEVEVKVYSIKNRKKLLAILPYNKDEWVEWHIARVRLGNSFTLIKAEGTREEVQRKVEMRTMAETQILY